MNISRFKEILKEEVSSVLKEASITKRFSKAVEALQSIQLKQQQLRKKFVSEKDAKKKEALKQSLITLHKQVQRAESDFNQAVTSEPIDLEEKKNKGLWANIHAKRKRGEKPAHKNSKAHKDAVKAAKSINKEGKLNEDAFKSFLSDDPAFKLYTATNTENRKSVKARKTDKTFDDGVPVLKYIARASKKDSPLPKGKFKIIEDNKHGWWYYLNSGTWYGIQQKDYGTPPFEY
jgi:hypothetical protein|tara:strand:- start:8137 stop:8835 length:699 start_codon:yes stop_codon:yes gene_type:complete